MTVKSWHDAQRFEGLLRRAVRIAAEKSDVAAELTEAFTERYGKTYSDIDCDELIDVLDYGSGGKLTVKQVDKLMED
jgi:phenylpyruvate tautomerase PptA (4-oxalocrotonate tautomerase family)